VRSTWCQKYKFVEAASPLDIVVFDRLNISNNYHRSFTPTVTTLKLLAST